MAMGAAGVSVAVGAGVEVGIGVSAGSGVAVGIGVEEGTGVAVGISAGISVLLITLVGSDVTASVGTEAVSVACTALATRSGSGVELVHPPRRILNKIIITERRFMGVLFLWYVAFTCMSYLGCFVSGKIDAKCH